jgi:type VI protein secretion system component Hcp
MAIYLKVPDVKGNVSTTKFENWIEIHDVEFGGITNPVSMRVGSVTDRNASAPRFGQVTLLKSTDQSSTDFFEAAHDGTVFKEMEFNYVSSGSEPTVYGKLTLTDAMVTYFADKHHEAADKPLELIRLAYTQIKKTVIPRDSKNKLGSPLITGYDIEKASKL